MSTPYFLQSTNYELMDKYLDTLHDKVLPRCRCCKPKPKGVKKK